MIIFDVLEAIMSGRKIIYLIVATVLLVFSNWALAALSQQEISIDKTYVKLKRVLLLNNEKKALDKLIVSQKRFEQQKDQCKDANCLQALYKARHAELVTNWLSSGHGALTYTDAMDMAAPFEKALEQNNAKPLTAHLRFPVVIRHGDTDRLFLSKKEFVKYFPTVMRELSNDKEWQLGVAELGAGSQASEPIIALGKPSAEPNLYQFVSGANDVITFPASRELPSDLVKLEKEHETLFDPQQSITGTYISSNGTIYVRALSENDTQIVFSLVEDSVGLFSGISRDSSKGKMEFIATNSQFQYPNKTPPTGCLLKAKFSANKVIVDAGNCDSSGFFGNKVSAAGSYLRVSANEPTPGEMSISD